MKVSEGIKSATKAGKKIWRAATSSESTQAEHVRKNLAYSSMFLAGAALCTFAGMFLLKATAKEASQHAEWKHQDQMLDEAINDSLDASDAVAQY